MISIAAFCKNYIHEDIYIYIESEKYLDRYIYIYVYIYICIYIYAVYIYIQQPFIVKKMYLHVCSYEHKICTCIRASNVLTSKQWLPSPTTNNASETMSSLEQLLATIAFHAPY